MGAKSTTVPNATRADQRECNGHILLYQSNPLAPISAGHRVAQIRSIKGNSNNLESNCAAQILNYINQLSSMEKRNPIEQTVWAIDLPNIHIFMSQSNRRNHQKNKNQIAPHKQTRTETLTSNNQNVLAHPLLRYSSPSIVWKQQRSRTVAEDANNKDNIRWLSIWRWMIEIIGARPRWTFPAPQPTTIELQRRYYYSLLQLWRILMSCAARLPPTEAI